MNGIFAVLLCTNGVEYKILNFPQYALSLFSRMSSLTLVLLSPPKTDFLLLSGLVLFSLPRRITKV